MLYLALSRDAGKILVSQKSILFDNKAYALQTVQKLGNELASSVPLHFYGRILVSWYTQERGDAVSPYATALGATGPHDGDVLLGPYVEIQNRHFKAQTCQGTQGHNHSTSKQNVKVSGRPGFKRKNKLNLQ